MGAVAGLGPSDLRGIHTGATRPHQGKFCSLGLPLKTVAPALASPLEPHPATPPWPPGLLLSTNELRSMVRCKNVPSGGWLGSCPLLRHTGAQSTQHALQDNC